MTFYKVSPNNTNIHQDSTCWILVDNLPFNTANTYVIVKSTKQLQKMVGAYPWRFARLPLWQNALLCPNPQSPGSPTGLGLSKCPTDTSHLPVSPVSPPLRHTVTPGLSASLLGRLHTILLFTPRLFTTLFDDCIQSHPGKNHLLSTCPPPSSAKGMVYCP